MPNTDSKTRDFRKAMRRKLARLDPLIEAETLKAAFEVFGVPTLYDVPAGKRDEFAAFLDKEVAARTAETTERRTLGQARRTFARSIMAMFADHHPLVRQRVLTLAGAEFDLVPRAPDAVEGEGAPTPIDPEAVPFLLSTLPSGKRNAFRTFCKAELKKLLRAGAQKKRVNTA